MNQVGEHNERHFWMSQEFQAAEKLRAQRMVPGNNYKSTIKAPIKHMRHHFKERGQPSA